MEKAQKKTKRVDQNPRRSRGRAKPVQMKRFTLDVPLELHTRIKTQCASEGLKMTDVLREMLELRFPAKS
jgi:hypothetical protein